MFVEIEKNRKTAIYIRISTSMQQTDRQKEELLEYANKNCIAINEDDDIYIDIISGFKDGEVRPNYGILKRKVEDGIYQQILFSEFSRLDRKPSNLLKSISKVTYSLRLFNASFSNSYIYEKSTFSESFSG